MVYNFVLHQHIHEEDGTGAVRSLGDSHQPIDGLVGEEAAHVGAETQAMVAHQRIAFGVHLNPGGKKGQMTRCKYRFLDTMMNDTAQ